MLKKTTLAVIGLAASSFAFAGAMGPVCVPGNVTVPSCDPNRWDFGLQALYLQTIYGSEKNTTQSGPEVNNKWNFGFRAEGSYHYNSGSDITIDWTHYSSDTIQSGLVGFVPALPFSAPYTLINTNRLNQIDLVMGQHADFGLVKKMRFYGGMKYASVQANENDFFSPLLLSIGVSPVNFFDNTDFKGFGPVVGIDYSYNVTPAIKVTANGAGSILYGTTRYDAGFVASSVGLVLLQTYQAVHTIVPTVEAKLGLNYEYNMPNGILNVEGGYQVLNYFNVFQTQALQSSSSSIVRADYGLYGPYLGLKYLGNA